MNAAADERALLTSQRYYFRKLPDTIRHHYDAIATQFFLRENSQSQIYSGTSSRSFWIYWLCSLYNISIYKVV